MNIDRTVTKDEYIKQLLNLQQELIKYDKIENKEAIRKTYASKNYDENDLDGEIWKNFPRNPEYLVSNLGRIKFEGKIQHQTEEIESETGRIKWGYLVLEDQKLIKDYIYDFVAYTFLNKVKGDGYQVHHITNDGDDNSVNNLILLTAAEHSIVHSRIEKIDELL